MNPQDQLRSTIAQDRVFRLPWETRLLPGLHQSAVQALFLTLAVLGLVGRVYSQIPGLPSRLASVSGQKSSSSGQPSLSNNNSFRCGFDAGGSVTSALVDEELPAQESYFSLHCRGPWGDTPPALTDGQSSGKSSKDESRPRPPSPPPAIFSG
jgi:hypothetical protein